MVLNHYSLSWLCIHHILSNDIQETNMMKSPVKKTSVPLSTPPTHNQQRWCESHGEVLRMNQTLPRENISSEEFRKCCEDKPAGKTDFVKDVLRRYESMAAAKSVRNFLILFCFTYYVFCWYSGRGTMRARTMFCWLTKHAFVTRDC